MLTQATSALERYFEFERLGANWRTEVLAGLTTFVTMSYIVFVNPSILKDAGMPLAAVMSATCLSAAFGSILMGVFARYPIALAPGMGLNAYFTYTVVQGMGVPWQTALGAVFLSGVTFLLLTLAGVRQWTVAAIPKELYAAVSAGIGLFIAFIGLRNAGLVVASPSTMVTIGNLREPGTALAALGIVLIGAFQVWKVRAAILAGMLATTVIGAAAGLVRWQPQPYRLGDISGTWMQLDIRSALEIGLLEIVFVFLFVDLFDNLGTLVGVSKRAGLIGPGGEIPRLNRILLCDASATIAGSLAGTTTVVSYIESASGVAAGGRTGVVSIVVGLLFLVAIFIAPLLGAVPAAATAPALIVVGGLMLHGIGEIDWDDAGAAIPAFLTLVTIPLTFSIANGLAFGMIAHVLLRVLRGESRRIPAGAYTLAILLIVRFAYMGAS